MERRAPFIAVGIAAVLLIVGLLGFALWLGRFQFQQRFADYDADFQGPVRGLSEGAEVRFNGIKVGVVRELRLDPKDPTRVLARMRIDAATPVRVGTIAQLEQMGLTGVSMVQLTGSKPNAAKLAADTMFGPPRIPTKTAQIDAIFEGGEDLVGAARVAVGRVNDILDETNRKRLANILDNLEEVSALLASRQGVIASAQRAAQSAEAALAKAGTAVDAINATAEQFKAAGTATANLMTNTDQRIGTMEADLKEAVKQLRIASQGFAAISADARALVIETRAVASRAAGTLDQASALAGESTGTLQDLRADTLPELARASERIARAAESFETLANRLERESLAISAERTPPLAKVKP